MVFTILGLWSCARPDPGLTFEPDPVSLAIRLSQECALAEPRAISAEETVHVSFDERVVAGWDADAPWDDQQPVTAWARAVDEQTVAVHAELSCVEGEVPAAGSYESEVIFWYYGGGSESLSGLGVVVEVTD